MSSYREQATFKALLRCENKKDEMDWACNSDGASRNGENVFSEYLEGRKYWRDLILRLMLKLQLRE